MTRSKVISFGMPDETLRRRIAQAARDSAHVIFSPHALQRMRQRRVLLTQVLQVLQKGTVVEHAHQNIHGNWQCTLQGLVAGDRVKVAAALHEQDGEMVVVVTVMRN